MKIQIFGSGCPNCKRLEANADAAVKAAGIQAEIEKVTEIEKIIEMGVMSTPALAIDGVVKSTGRVLTKDQIVQMIKGEK
jgi:small redox-active disulfide protein 2